MGRATERKKELPLAQNENQHYIQYHKGSLALYLLQDLLGEDTRERRAARLLAAHAFKGPPYPTVDALVDGLRGDAARQGLPDRRPVRIHRAVRKPRRQRRRARVRTASTR
jgi:hypothetical protein